MQQIKRIGERFWYQTQVAETDRPVLGMVVGNERTLMIDAGNSEKHAQLFLDEMKSQGVPRPDVVALTHAHWDHIFGLPVVNNIPSIAHTKTKQEMAKLIPLSWSNEAIDERVEAGTEIEFCATAIKKEFPDERDIKIVLPMITFDTKMEIDLGGVTCILQHVGGDHAGDSVVVFIKEEKILFLGDSIYCNMYAPKWNYTVEKTQALVEQLMKFEADTYILSHSGVISRDEFEQEMAVFREIGDLTEQFEGDEGKVKQEYESRLGRELNEGELETIQYFVNGWSLYNV